MPWCRWIPRSISPFWFVCCPLEQNITYISIAPTTKQDWFFINFSAYLFINYKWKIWMLNRSSQLEDYQDYIIRKTSNFWENDWSTCLYLSANQVMKRSPFKHLFHKRKGRNEKIVCGLITAKRIKRKNYL